MATIAVDEAHPLSAVATRGPRMPFGGPNALREGQTYEVGRRLGELLIAWGYAEEVRRDNQDLATDKPGRSQVVFSAS